MRESRQSAFWRKVDWQNNDGCWEWKAGKTRRGYGSFAPDGYNTQLAHRVSFDFFFGPIPPGLCVIHKCDNTSCVNPLHLETGTHLENMQDAARKGRKGKKLNVDKVRQIRRLLGKIPQSKIANKFGILQSNVSAIATGKSWGKIK